MNVVILIALILRTIILQLASRVSALAFAEGSLQGSEGCAGDSRQNQREKIPG